MINLHDGSPNTYTITTISSGSQWLRVALIWCFMKGPDAYSPCMRIPLKLGTL